MDGPGDDDPDDGAAERVDRQQLLLVAVCFAAIVVAAALAPTPVTPDVETPGPREPTPERTPAAGSGDSEGDEGGGEGDEGGSDGTSGGDAGSGRVLDGEGEPAPVPGGSAPETEGCGVVLEDEPIPGRQVTVGVYVDTEPVSGVEVQFNGDPVGRTNERGRVSGPVPYNHTLAVSVGLDADCRFYRERFDDPSDGDAASVEGASGASLARGAVGAEPSGLTAGIDPGVGSPGPGAGGVRTTTPEPKNATGTYAVRGDLNVTLRGDAYPGTAVTLVATIEGVPVPEASVSVDGSTVGETGSRGRTDLRVPDGKQAVPVTVGRGDFEGTATLDVLLLTAAVRPREGFPVPGERAAVEARVDDRPAEDVAVRVAGRRVGATDRDGLVEFGLPLSTAERAVASTDRQSATVPLWRLYVPTALNLFAVLSAGVVGIVGARLLRGPDAAAHVAFGWVAVAVADAALVVGELVGLGLALLGIGAVGLLHQRRRVRAGGEQAVGAVVALVALARRTALRVTQLLERGVDWLWRFLGRTWTRLTSFERFVAWVGGLVRRTLATVWIYLTLRRAGVALFALAELSVATARWGHEGLVASVAGLGVLAALVALLRREGPAPPSPDEDDDAPGRGTRRAVDRETGESRERVLSIRELWRRFARWVVPGSWRTKTPGEVARAAVDRGFPRGPVEALTDAFRDVEYGAEPATSRRDRAKAAFDRLARANGEDDE